MIGAFSPAFVRKIRAPIKDAAAQRHLPTLSAYAFTQIGRPAPFRLQAASTNKPVTHYQLLADARRAAFPITTQIEVQIALVRTITIRTDHCREAVTARLVQQLPKGTAPPACPSILSHFGGGNEALPLRATVFHSSDMRSGNDATT